MIHIKSSVSFQQMTSLASSPPQVAKTSLILNRALSIRPARLNNLPNLTSSIPDPAPLAHLHHYGGRCQLLAANGHRLAWLQLVVVAWPELGNSCKEIVVNNRSSLPRLLPANRRRAGWGNQELLLKRRWRQEDVTCTGRGAHAKPVNMNCVPPNNCCIHGCLCC